jgi:predicted nucleotidyltransferase
MTIEEINKKATPILRANGVEFAAIFGSAARGQAHPDSDVDFLVRYKVTPSLFDHIGLAQDLEDTLHTKVDVVTERSLKKSLVPYVKKDLRILYGNGQRQDLY